MSSSFWEIEIIILWQKKKKSSFFSFSLFTICFFLTKLCKCLTKMIADLETVNPMIHVYDDDDKGFECGKKDNEERDTWKRQQGSGFLSSDCSLWIRLSRMKMNLSPFTKPIMTQTASTQARNHFTGGFFWRRRMRLRRQLRMPGRKGKEDSEERGQVWGFNGSDFVDIRFVIWSDFYHNIYTYICIYIFWFNFSFNISLLILGF